MTNAERFIQDTERLAKLISESDDFDMGLGICTLTYNEYDEIEGCKRHGNGENCQECIKEWLEQEAK